MLFSKNFHSGPGHLPIWFLAWFCFVSFIFVWISFYFRLNRSVSHTHSLSLRLKWNSSKSENSLAAKPSSIFCVSGTFIQTHILYTDIPIHRHRLLNLSRKKRSRGKYQFIYLDICDAFVAIYTVFHSRRVCAC